MSTDQQDELEHLDPYDPFPEVIYTFSSLQYLDDLKLGRLWFAPTSTYNDIHENTIFARDTVTYDFSTAWEAEALINEWLESQVVRCFTTDPTNTLMWSHYADSHKGVCVGYKLNLLSQFVHEEQPLRNYRIRYSSVPPLSLISGPNSQDTILHLARDILMTKSSDWAYEKEHRFWAAIPEMSKAGGGIIDVGVEAVVDVIFGAKVDTEAIDQLRSKLPDGVQARAAEHNSRALSYNLQIRNL